MGESSFAPQRPGMTAEPWREEMEALKAGLVRQGLRVAQLECRTQALMETLSESLLRMGGDPAELNRRVRELEIKHLRDLLSGMKSPEE